MKPKYFLNDQGEFVIENYNYAKPFANFFPGIAGKYGIPMWVFYVNRGQAISSFGTKGKGHSILEFFPANKSWQLVTSHGFRTFIKIAGTKPGSYYEPFHNGPLSREFALSNRMLISPSGLTIEEENRTLGLKVKVDYFNIPNDSYAGLVRQVTVENLSRKPKKIQVLDGLPQITPFGTTNLFLKQLGRTIEAWMRVENLEKNVPFFKLDVDPTDRPEVIHIKEGHFYLGFIEEGNKTEIIKPIIDPECVFGPITDFSYPQKFLSAKNFLYPEKQVNNSKTPCAMLLINLNLPAQAKKRLSSIIGYMRSLNNLNASIKRISKPAYLEEKSRENKEIIDGLTRDIFTESSSRELNLYARQTYLDNIMRGGYPVIFKFGKSSSVFYLYSRKHGDLERDYNRYSIQPTYFSQGNGNFRDINQNRRCDVWFNPEIEEENVVYFFNLLQPDGFNPLIIKGTNFIIKDQTYLKAVLKDLAEEDQIERITAFLSRPFTPGELILFLQENRIKLLRPAEDAVKILLSHSIKTQEAEHEGGDKTGYWTDHWTYNLDLLESYLGVYPDKLKGLLFDKKIFTFYDPPVSVRPRSKKYLLYEGKPRQMQSAAFDDTKTAQLNKRTILPNVVRTQYGSGEIYQTSLINKLLCLLANKLASLDPLGVGIEMEANKPNWYDALNGLPALFGSSLCETLELKRLVLFIKETLQKTKVGKVLASEETHEFLLKLANLLTNNLESNAQNKDYLYWDESSCLKEAFREKTKMGFSGKESELDINTLEEILDRSMEKINAGIQRAKEKNIYYSYFINEVTDYETIDGSVRPLKFAQKRLPLFLEGQMHALRLAESHPEAKKLYQATKQSPLFDRKLKMYKVTAPLKSEPFEIGRCRVFAPGWLENESIWLHMEYKYLLEALKQGLYEEFYADFKQVLVPFQDPQTYGRSILENSSFLVSSAFPDKNLHGNGFVARLSGSTAEFIQMWLIMNCGHKPFFLDADNKLCLKFAPALAGWLFTKGATYNFNFLSSISVTYHNPKRKDTFGKSAVKVRQISFKDKDAKAVRLSSDTIPSPYAEQIRSRQVTKIEIYLI